MLKSSLITKTNFRRRSRSRPLLVIIPLIFVAIICLTLFVSQVGNATSYAARPLGYAANLLENGIRGFGAYLENETSASRERDALLAEIEQYNAERLSRDVRDREHAALRSLVGLAPEERIVAGIIARPNHTPYDTIYIDRGKDDGVEEGGYAYAGADVVIGSVIRAYDKSAVVELYSTPGVESRVYVYGPDVAANAEGQGGGILRIALPRGLPLNVGDPVVLPTVPLRVLGEVSEIESDEQGPDVYAYVGLPISIQSLRYVAVGRSVLPQMTDSELEEAVNNASSTRAFIGSLFVPSEQVATSTEESLDQEVVEEEGGARTE